MAGGAATQLIRFAGGVIASAVPLFAGSSEGVNANGQPTKRYVAELIKARRYVKKSTEQVFDFSRDDLIKYAATFSKMKAAGVVVPIQNGHNDDADMTRGNTQDIFVGVDAKGQQTLFGIIEMVGRDAIELAGRTLLSIYAKPEFVDGHGNNYKDAILHIACVPNPVVPDQMGLVPIGLSHGSQQQHKVPAFEIFELDQGAPNMDPIMQLAQALGVDLAGKQGPEAMAALIAAATALKAQATQHTQVAASLATTKTELEALKLSQGKKVEANPDVLEANAELGQAKLDKLEAAGRISTGCRKDLELALVGTVDTRASKAVCLSRASATAAGLSDTLLNLVVSALEKNDPKELGEKFKGQAARLARDTPGNGDDAQSIKDQDALIAANEKEINAGRK